MRCFSTRLRRISVFLVVVGLIAVLPLTATPSRIRIGSSSTNPDPPGDPDNVTSISQYGITWEFEGEVQAGTFVNGDNWVVGPVVVSSVTPGPKFENGEYINGSMVNPVAGQGYDSRSYSFDIGQRVSFPLLLNPNDSLVSSISIDSSVSDEFTFLQTAAVLTVLDSAPPAGSFRPALMGSTKKLHNTADIQWHLLPTLAQPASVPDESYIESYYTRWFERPWLMHLAGWTNRSINPVDNYPDYHQWIAFRLSHFAVLVLTDIDNREARLINYLQVGIDMHAAGTTPGAVGPRAFYAWPVIFAGMMLGDNDMRDVFETGSSIAQDYNRENIYYYDDNQRTVFSSILPPGQGWTGATVLWAAHHGDDGDHELLHPDEWSWIEAEGYPGGGSKQETYRTMHSPHIIGFVLAARIFGMESKFGHQAYLDYADRYMTETRAMLEAIGGSHVTGVYNIYPPNSSDSQFVDDMWQIHR